MFHNKHELLMFEPIAKNIEVTNPHFKSRDVSKLPASELLNSFLNLKNLNNKQLTFINQNKMIEYPDLGYEERIYNHGLIATRAKNWHDYFNALIWLKFPQSKSAINAIHHQETKTQVSSLRSPKRDLLTLFDECGVLIIAENEIYNLIKQHKWHELFIENKEQWLNGKIKIITFGHAMYEKYLTPYIGMTAKAMFLVPDTKDIDSYLAHKLLNHEILTSKSELSPLPVLGIPNWNKNQTLDFYSNPNYFR